MAYIYFQCSCEKNLAVGESAAGRMVKCPDCGKPITVPQPEIECDCNCGQPMLAPKSMAGKRVQCVECKVYMDIPARPPAKLSLKKTEPLEPPRCPSCKALITAASVYCMNCGLNLKTGERFKYVAKTETATSFPLKPIIIAAAVVVCGIAVWMMGKSPKIAQVSPLASASSNQTEIEKQPVGSPADKPIASSQTVKASDNDISDAKRQYEIGNKYYSGEGVSKDFTKAVEWFRKAAEQGYAKAQSQLGWCYANGHGVLLDYCKQAVV